MNVLLGVTGSVAAIRTPELYQALRQAGHEVKVVATQAALYFFDPTGIGQPSEGSGRARLPPSRVGDGSAGASPSLRNREVVILDEDEWPGQDIGRRYKRDDLVLHIELRRWGDLLLIAPLDANTLAKLAAGLSDNCLTCVWRAWDPNRPVMLAPAMNTLMWEHPMTAHHLRMVARDSVAVAATEWRATLAAIPEHLDLEEFMDWINQNCPKLRIVPPVSKRLACGDIGVGAMAAVPEIVKAVEEQIEGSVESGRKASGEPSDKREAALDSGREEHAKATASTVSICVSPEAASWVELLGMEAEFEKMLEHAKASIPALRSIDVTLNRQPSQRVEAQVFLMATMDDPALDDDVAQATKLNWDKWVMDSFSPDVNRHFVMMTRYEPSIERE
jgi:phosphopantothenoylcysteine decarboxylase